MSFLAAVPILINPAKAKLLSQWKHKSPLIGCRFAPTELPSGEFVFASSEDNNIVRWQLSSGKATILSGHKSWVRALAFAGKTMFTGDWAGRLLAWDFGAETPTPVQNLAAHKGWLRALAVSPDGKTLASCGNDRRIKLWSVEECKLLREWEGHDSHIYNLAWHPDGKHLATGDLKGVIKIWDMATQQSPRELDAKVMHKYDAGFGADIGGVRSMTFDAKGKSLACAGITNVSNAFAGVGNPLIVLFDFATGKRTLLTPKVAFQGTMWGVVFHPQSWVIGVAGGNGGRIWGWKLGETQATTEIVVPVNLRDLALHTDERRIAIAGADGVLRVYDLLG